MLILLLFWEVSCHIVVGGWKDRRTRTRATREWVDVTIGKLTEKVGEAAVVAQCLRSPCLWREQKREQQLTVLTKLWRWPVEGRTPG